MTNPYQALPAHCFWKRSIAAPAPADVDPVVRSKFTVIPSDRVATAGSCFAQHIARHLRSSGFGYMVTETAHPLVTNHADAEYNYGTYTARYGNLYTARQLLQLLQRAYGLFEPLESAWPAAAGRYIDPFRPQIQPDGFSSSTELTEDRRWHLSKVRDMVETCDVFVFTLGLTEAWLSKRDGAVFPLCPGVAGGSFDEDLHRFHNFDVSETTSDLSGAIKILRERNPNVRIILTVSPVPLVATYENRSVLVSTTYSKSVLRVAAEVVSSGDDRIDYFPSYEVITGGYTRGRYFAEDLRSIRDEGVAHVMRLFMSHYTAAGSGRAGERLPPQDGQPAERDDLDAAGLVALICEEEALDPAWAHATT